MGTTFKIYLPRWAEGASRAAGAAKAAPGTSRRGTETVLLVEDAAAVRAVTHQALARQGLHGADAPNGAEALRIAASPPGADPPVTDRRRDAGG